MMGASPPATPSQPLQRLSSRVNKIKVPIHDLKPGMFVCELDRPWLGTPFLLEGVLVRGPNEIEELGKYSRHVFVDPDKSVGSVVAHLKTLRPPELAEAGQPRARFRHPHAVEYQDAAPLAQELKTAREVRDNVLQLIRGIEGDLMSDRVLDRTRFEEAMQGMTDSIIRNPDALFLLQKLREVDSQTWGRAIDLSIYILAFGRHLGFPRDELLLLGMGGLLLDIGKLKLPPQLIAKKTPLSGDEHRMWKTHVELGSELLSRQPWVPAVIMEMTTTHHEREDGSGYPRGLRGPQIGIYGRIAGIVDTYEDLISHQAFAPALPPHAALRTMSELKGRLFQDDLIEEFIQCLGVHPVGSLVELSSGEVGVVLENNRVRRLKPKVMVLLDPKKRRCPEPRLLDLDQPRPAGAPVIEITRPLEFGAYGIDPQEYYL